VVAAVISGLVSGISVWIAARTTRRIHTEKLAFDHEQAERRAAVELRLIERKFELDANLAERRFRLDADFADRKRKQDLAEEVISGFYQLHDMVRVIRSPLSYSGEAKDRPKPDSEPEEVGRLKDSYFAVLARFEERRQMISDLLAKEYRVRAWFGASAAESFKILNEALTSIVTSSQTLIELAGSDSRTDEDRQLRRQLERDIWWGRKPDIIDIKIAEATAKIEEIARPTLESGAA
jgi:hypothetical protein